MSARRFNNCQSAAQRSSVDVKQRTARPSARLPLPRVRTTDGMVPHQYRPDLTHKHKHKHIRRDMLVALVITSFGRTMIREWVAPSHQPTARDVQIIERSASLIRGARRILERNDNGAARSPPVYK